MSEILASYSFLPWVRQGLGNEIIEADTLGNALPNNAAVERPEILVKTTVKATKGEDNVSASISKTVKVQGPGDVLGINPKTIIRVHPKKGVDNFETNNLCYVEFYEEDLPWRFTPAKPVGNKLRPWLALIVLREDEFEKSTGGTPTPFISIDNTCLGDVFCNEKDTYALAHLHVLEDLGNNNGNEATQLSGKLQQNPDLALSRVMCARKLEYIQNGDNTYHAFLIPAFETGRLAGMGLDTAATPAQQPSWSRAAISNGTNPVSYPYYFTWSFKVDPNGDFETLAKLLEARELPENIGKREMDMREMGFGIEPVGDDAIAYVEGAMRHPDYVTAPWPMSDQDLKNQLRDVLNISANLQDTFQTFTNNPFFYSPALDEDPIISPPTYGMWHKGINRLSQNGNDWVHTLNLHPGNRSAAGLGVQVVQKHQEEFMEMAWEQIGDINEANQKIIESELMKRATRSMAAKKVFKLGEFDFVNATGKAFEVLKLNANNTAKRIIKNSTVPTALRSGTFLKVANNFTPTALMTANGSDGATAVLNAQLYAKLNLPEGDNGKISAAPKRQEPAMLLPGATAYTAIESVVTSPQPTFMQTLAEAIKQEGVDFDKAAVMANLPGDFTSDQTTRASEILDGVKKATLGQGNVEIEVTIEEDVFNERISENFDEGLYEGVLFVKPAINVAEALIFDHAAILENRAEYFNKFSSRFIIKVNDQPKVQLHKRPTRDVLPDDLHTNIRLKLNPVLNFNRKLASWFVQNYNNNNKPIMAYPRFPIPMYDYLKDISLDYIIPNISEIEPNTITLMETNRQFIESFLMGMNHEFSRELLWREFPTDMRGSYFRHFWEYDNDPSAEIQPGESVEDYTNRILNLQNTRADIKEIHKWNAALGFNEERPGPDLVLLIKGDLLRKYPNTLVYAQRARFIPNDNNKMRELGEYDPNDKDKVKWPIITGNIEPDVYFFGFELSQEEANGNRTDNPGWFFVLRERPGQISFGLDDYDVDDGPLNTTPNNWDEVTWEHITGNINQQPPYLKIDGVTINLNANGTGPRVAQWGASSSDMAYILYQSPILFARHASTMLND